MKEAHSLLETNIRYNVISLLYKYRVYSKIRLGLNHRTLWESVVVLERSVDITRDIPKRRLNRID